MAASPSAAHIACFIRKKYGWLNRFMASTADALYTITTLAHTSSSVARNSTLSDFSFRAIVTSLGPGQTEPYSSPAPAPRKTVNVRASGQQSSVSRGVGTPASQAGAACVPSSQLPTAAGRLTTVHCSRVLLASSASLRTSCLNTSAAFRVIAEHVEARARGRQQHRATRRAPASKRSLTAASRRSGRLDRHHAFERLPDERQPLRRSPRPRACRASSGSRSRRKSPPLNRPPIITTRPESKLSIARCAASTLVAFESLTNRTPLIDRDRLERMFEPGERLDGLHHRVWRHAGDSRDRRGRHHIAEQVAADQPDRRERHQRVRAVSHRDEGDPSSSRRYSVGARARASASVCGSSALITAQSSSVWFAKILAFAAA